MGVLLSVWYHGCLLCFTFNLYHPTPWPWFWFYNIQHIRALYSVIPLRNWKTNQKKVLKDESGCNTPNKKVFHISQSMFFFLSFFFFLHHLTCEPSKHSWVELISLGRDVLLPLRHPITAKSFEASVAFLAQIARPHQPPAVDPHQRMPTWPGWPGRASGARAPRTPKASIPAGGPIFPSCLSDKQSKHKEKSIINHSLALSGRSEK